MLGEPCETCGEKYPSRRQFINETKTWICDRCGVSSSPSFPDVYWDGKPEINLADGPDGKPRVFLSKREKAAYLRERGIMEAGDRVGGAPFQYKREDPSVLKQRRIAEFREAERKVKQMGQDQKRQAILKVIQDARRYGLDNKGR